MYSPASFRNRPGASRRGFGLLALTLMLAITSTPGRAQTDATPATPPSFPDAAHVINGCFLSATAYIAKLQAAFPAEKAEPITVRMVNQGGRILPHKIVLLTWRGEWWARDEFFGVFALGRPVGDGKINERVRQRAETRLEQHAHGLVAAGASQLPAVAPERMDARQRIAAVTAARGLLPFATEIFWADCGDEEFPFLFFRPAPGVIAVYDPLHGTAKAECPMTDDAAIVALAAQKLGYRVAAVRADFTRAGGTKIAGTNPALEGMAR